MNSENLHSSLRETLPQIGNSRPPGSALREMLVPLIGYALWILLYQLLLTSMITSFLLNSTNRPRFQDIAEVYTANELTLTGLGAFLYVLFLFTLFPILKIQRKDFWDPRVFERLFIPGFAQGAVIAFGISLAFLASQSHEYVGAWITTESGGAFLIQWTVRVIGLLLLVYCEEFLFRGYALLSLRKWASQKFKTSDRNLHWFCVFWTSLAYILMKSIQFELGWRHLLTLGIFALYSGTRAWLDQSYIRGAGWIAGLLIVFQPLLGMPLWGTEYTGILLIQYLPAKSLPGVDALTYDAEFASNLLRWITGGAGGPLASVSLQGVLLFQWIRLLRQSNFIQLRKTPKISHP